MYLYDYDLIKQKLTAEGKLNRSEILKMILSDASLDSKRRFMSVGERYYLGRHDILCHDFQSTKVYDTAPDPENPDKSIDVTTNVINRNNSNLHNVHPFHRLMVDQKAAYIAGKPPAITVDGDNEFETAISERTSDPKFSDMILEWVIGASNKGIEWVHVYYDENGELNYCIVPANEIIAFYDSENQTVLQEVIRFYMFDVITGSGAVRRHKIEWWTASDVTYFIEDDKGNYGLDNSYPCNPMPHWFDVISVDGMEQKRIPQSFGRVPFIALHNNSWDLSDLGGEDNDGRPQGIKSLIDAYDMISSAATNDQIDLVGLYWVIQGFGGETAQQVIKKLQINKAVCVDGGDGGITAQQPQLNVEERIKWLEMLRKDIFHFGMGIDTSDENMGRNPSGVALKFKYMQLDLKANPLILKLKKALRELLRFITEDINRKQGTSYDYSKINVTVNKSMAANDSETVSMINASRGLVPDKILLAAHPLVDNVSEAERELEEQKASQNYTE